MFKKIKDTIKFHNPWEKWAVIICLAVLLMVGFSAAKADCTGCGEGGHEQCPIEEGAHSHPPEVVFAVCVFSDGHLIDHKGANNMSDCLKTKREVEKLWRNRAEGTDSVEINGVTYKIDGESLNFMCDLVDAEVHHYNDGSWEIIKILGKHKKDE